ncbi:MAG: VOC family protein [Rhodospirillales bacterium]
MSDGRPELPKIAGILETAVYVDDLRTARSFYEDRLGLRCMFEDARLCAIDVGGRGVLLLFQRGESLAPVKLPGGTIPPHDGHGPLHMAFAVTGDELRAWEETLPALGVPIESTVDWPRGGRSIYFRDPDRHLLEMASPGIWPIY